MRRGSILSTITKLDTRIFTTNQLSSASRKSPSAVNQSLNNLVKEGAVIKIYRGIWAIRLGGEDISPYAVMPYLFPAARAYVSFISALHIYGIIEQIPQVTTIASTAHTRTIRTAAGDFYAHRITPSFFAGFDWYKKSGSFLIAEPEKALVDSLYLSAYKKKHFGNFPELNFPESFSFKKARMWDSRIPSPKARVYAAKKLAEIASSFAHPKIT